MQYVIMLIVGIFVGAIARFIMPGADHMGWLMTGLLGIAGSYVGGFVGKLVFNKGQDAIHPAGFLLSVLGALILLFIARHFFNVA